MKDEIKEIDIDDKEKFAATIPIARWNDIERKMAIVSRMTSEPNPVSMDHNDT